MSADTPTDPQALRDEIARTRADLGATVEALAAKTDVMARAQDAAADVADQAKAKVRELRDHTADAVDTLAGQVRSGAETVRESLADLDVPATLRKLPVAGILAAAMAVGILIWLTRRRRT